MITQRWKTSFSLIADRTRVSSAERRGSMDGVAERHIPQRQRAVPGGDIPVFDHQQQQIGLIHVPEGSVDESMLTREGRMSHGMNAPLSLFEQEAGDTPGAAVGWRRIPLLDHQSDICGIVVYPADPAPALVSDAPLGAIAGVAH
ncbi:MAG: hypothetical protein ABI129_00210 [Rhodanobacter sp.]